MEKMYYKIMFQQSYILYDGYYIYSAYDNTLDAEDKFDENASYKNGGKHIWIKTLYIL